MHNHGYQKNQIPCSVVYIRFSNNLENFLKKKSQITARLSIGSFMKCQCSSLRLLWLLVSFKYPFCHENRIKKGFMKESICETFLSWFCEAFEITRTTTGGRLFQIPGMGGYQKQKYPPTLVFKSSLLIYTSESACWFHPCSHDRMFPNQSPQQLWNCTPTTRS